MDGWEIATLIEAAGCQTAEFLGVFAKDVLPNPVDVPNQPICLISNTDNYHLPGTHWVAVYVNVPEGRGTYFDSLALPPFPQFIDFLNALTDGQWVYNSIALQAPYSTTCGQFCLMFVWFKCKGYSFDDFIEIFHKDRDLNDVIVTDFVRNHFGVDTPIINPDYIIA